MLKCQILTVKFFKSNEPRQEIRATEQPGGCHLDISREDGFLRVSYISHANFIVKQINFNLDDVKEYCCEHLIQSVGSSDGVSKEDIVSKS